MAGLTTQVPRRLALIEAPTTRNVAAMPDAAAPYKALAQQLDLFGGALNNLAKAAAPAAGREAVTRDESGNLKIDRAPVIGPAAALYDRAVKVSTVAAAEIEINGAISRMRQEFKGDPDSFETSVEEFRKQKIDQYDEIGGSDVGLAIGALVNRAGTWNLRGLTIEKQKKDAADAAKRLKLSADDKADDLVDLARSGATGTDAYKEVREDYTAVLADGADNPMVPLSSDDAAAHDAETAARSKTAAYIGAARRAFAEGGPERVAELRPHLDAIADPVQRDDMVKRIGFDLSAQQNHTEAEHFDTLRAEFSRSDARLSDGIGMLALGNLDSGWLDRHADRLGRRSFETLRLAVNAPPSTADEPQTAGALTVTALLDRRSAEDEATAAYAAGLITKETFGRTILFAAQTEQNAARPWANDLRRSIADQTNDIPGDGALGEFGTWLAQAQQATREDAQVRADLIVEQHRDMHARRLAATLPMPYATNRRPTKSQELDAAQAALASRAESGGITLADMANEMATLEQWRSIVKEA